MHFSSVNSFFTIPMNSSINLRFFTATRAIIVLLLLLLLLSPASCFTSLRGLLFAEKARLGSTPPSCHNKCNQCHPCMAVQVPTMPSRDLVRPVGKSRPAKPTMFFDPSHLDNRYSNYKPLGWKCHCGDHFFNP
ncbi:EPIDERMAL PATTERNING FACTOR-like protein 1 [Rosa sericea]